MSKFFQALEQAERDRALQQKRAVQSADSTASPAPEVEIAEPVTPQPPPADSSDGVDDHLISLIAPAAFESALITLGRVTVDGAQVRLADGPAVLDVEISVSGGKLEISTDTINQPPHPTRIALRCHGEVTHAAVKTVLRPA